MPQHVIVAGAAGYIGRHVVTALLERGARVSAIVRPGDASRLQPPSGRSEGRLSVIELDLLAPDTDLASLSAPAPDIYLHLAWEQGFVHNAPVHMLRLSDHYRVLRHFAEAGTGRLAVLGSRHEIGYHEGVVTAETPANPQSLYGIAKDSLRRAVFATLGEICPVQWLRAYYVYGDDRYNQSVFTKILQAADRGDRTFPFTSGQERYDFIHVAELGRQIAAAISQAHVTGIINVCSGEPRSFGEMAETFIREEGLPLRLDYGAYPDRPYDSPCIYGDATEILRILAADV